MSTARRLIYENDPVTHSQQRQLFGVVPDDESRARVISKLESFKPDYFERVTNTGEIPHIVGRDKKTVAPKEITHPGVKGFDLVVHAVAQLTGEERPLTFLTHSYNTDSDEKQCRQMVEIPYPFFFGEDESTTLAHNPMYNGFMYGLNVLKRTKDIEILDRSKIDPRYGFTTPEAIAKGAGGYLVAQCMVVDAKSGIFIDYENYYPTHYGEYAPSNLQRLMTLAVLSDDDTNRYVSNIPTTAKELVIVDN